MVEVRGIHGYLKTDDLVREAIVDLFDRLCIRMYEDYGRWVTELHCDKEWWLERSLAGRWQLRAGFPNGDIEHRDHAARILGWLLAHNAKANVVVCNGTHWRATELKPGELVTSVLDQSLVDRIEQNIALYNPSRRRRPPFEWAPPYVRDVLDFVLSSDPK